ncbi:MAG: ComEA family DNA-binding protein [Desulfobacterales bacterium]|nr:ComEA family DNA-binding protein [Desulfobacterales bacterium]
MKRLHFRQTLFFFILTLFSWNHQNAGAQGWSDLKIRLLPDESFAFIEVSESGNKIRHCPHHDVNAQLDEEQLIYEIGCFEKEIFLDPENKKQAEKHLQAHYDRFISKIMKNGLQNSININAAKLTELVRLPNIGPVLAVKIVEYREKNSLFESIEDIKRVDGIGRATYHAIRYYICTQ